MSGSDHFDAGEASEATPAGLSDAAVAISDTAHVRAVLIGAARARSPITYSDLLATLGHRFTRPKMRALCRTLDAIDEVGRAAGEPELAVLVVRQADGLPGQGWWVSMRASEADYEGPWTGPEALALVRKRQERAFAYWSSAS